MCIYTPSLSVAVNGEVAILGVREGFVKVYQPYCFFLCMEGLNGLFREEIEKGNFQFHDKCSEIGLSHICFADDLFIFSEGNPASVQSVKRILNAFSLATGLHPNVNKRKIYLSGVSNSVKDSMLSVLGYSEGSLTVDYLGVPLFLNTRLKVKDCRNLIERIASKIRSWTSNWLSYAGRLQLIKSVIFSMQVYWSSLFILPKKVLSAIQQSLRRFLWKGSSLDKGGCKVAWSDICSPFSEGGFGKSVYSFNSL